MKSLLLLIPLFLLMFNCQTMSPYRSFDPNNGDVEGNLYESVEGKFATMIPVDTKFSLMNDTASSVTFVQDGLGLFKIQSMALTLSLKEDIAKFGKQKAFQDFVERKIYGSFQKLKTETSLLYSAYNEDFRNGVYFFVLKVEEQESNPLTKQFPAFAMMVFSTDSHLYILTRDTEPIEPQPLVTTKEKPSKKKPIPIAIDPKIELAMDRLLDFHSRIFVLGDTLSDDMKEDFDFFADWQLAEESEEEGVGMGMMESSSFDLTGILRTLQKRLYVAPGRFTLRSERFKFKGFGSNSGRMKFNSNRFKFNSGIKPSRFKVKSSFKPGRMKVKF